MNKYRFIFVKNKSVDNFVMVQFFFLLFTVTKGQKGNIF